MVYIRLIFSIARTYRLFGLIRLFQPYSLYIYCSGDQSCRGIPRG
eukprot:COSAG02_NODE_45814_length_354_cov_0.513725_2_plen_44_part_01